MTDPDRHKGRNAPPLSCGRCRDLPPRAQAAHALRMPRIFRPTLPDWTRQLGDGVGVRAYGNPSKYEKDVVRRTVPWLTATPESSVSFTPLHQLDGIITPNGLCFERHHGGIAEIDPERLPADGAWARRQAADLHARRSQAAAARQQDLFSRMRRQFRHGMARRPAQWLPVHARHGALRAVHRRVAQAAAGAGRPQAERQVDHGGRRRRRRNEPLDPAEQGARRLHDRLSHERRNAASRAGLSGAPGGAGLGRQCLDQVAAPAQGRRSALVHARGNLEIHRPARKRQRRASSPS